MQKTVESLLFADVNEDSYTPMNIMAMVELSECGSICGGMYVEEKQQGGMNGRLDDQNRDTCIAVAGLPSNNTIMVKKYCIPKAQGRSVKSEPTETWFVWYSEEWSSTLMDLQFADTIYGDTLVAMRDNKGRTLATGPLEQIISIHPRAIQMDASVYYRYFSTAANRNDRLTYVSTTDYKVKKLDKLRDIPLSITDMFVLPTGGTHRRKAWIFLSYVVATDLNEDGAADDAMPITQTQRVDVCGSLSVTSFVQRLGELESADIPSKCNLNGFFDFMRQSSIMPIVMPSVSLDQARLLLVPTLKRQLTPGRPQVH